MLSLSKLVIHWSHLKKGLYHRPAGVNKQLWANCWRMCAVLAELWSGTSDSWFFSWVAVTAGKHALFQWRRNYCLWPLDVATGRVGTQPTWFASHLFYLYSYLFANTTFTASELLQVLQVHEWTHAVLHVLRLKSFHWPALPSEVCSESRSVLQNLLSCFWLGESPKLNTFIRRAAVSSTLLTESQLPSLSFLSLSQLSETLVSICPFPV